MDTAALLSDLYGRIPPLAREAVEGLTPAQLVAQPGGHPNSIGWLVWHVARVQDHQLTGVFGGEQHWTTGPWAARFGLEPDPENLGYGHSPAEVAQVRPDGVDALLGYLDAVDQRTRALLAALTDDDLDRVVDRDWDPPVTLGVRLVSVADDCLQHVGQAAYARGILLA